MIDKIKELTVYLNTVTVLLKSFNKLLMLVWISVKLINYIITEISNIA